MSRKKVQISDLDLSKIGCRFAYVRIKAGEEQAGFAKNIGISKANISSIENNKHNPSFIPIKNIVFKYSLNPLWLLYGEGDPYIYKDREGGDIPEDDPHRELLSMTREILTSDTDYSVSLSANIKSFHKALVTEKSLEQRVADLEEQHEKRIKKQTVNQPEEVVNYK